MSAENPENAALEKDVNNGVGNSAGNASRSSPQMTHEEEQVARAAARFGYGPLAQVNAQGAQLLPAFGGEFQPGLYRSVAGRKFGNPAPLGLCAFALTTFILGCINMGTRGISDASVVIGPAFGYGGLVQLLAGMWEMALGNTFGATALSSYGGFWIAFAIISTPGGFQILNTLEAADGGTASMFYDSMGLFLMGWFIFTTLLVLCTLKSTVAFFSLFFTLDLAFLLLGIGYLHRGDAETPSIPVLKAGGFFALLAAFLAWYNALAGMADSSNSFFTVPVAHFPWSEQAQVSRKTERETV